MPLADPSFSEALSDRYLLLRELGAAPEQIKAIAAVLGPRAREGGLKEGQKVRVLAAPAGPGRVQPLRIIIAGDTVEAAVALSDMGKYVPVDVHAVETDVAEASEDDENDDGSGVRLYQSLYETGLRNNVPHASVCGGRRSALVSETRR